MTFAFGDYELDGERRELRRGGEQVALEPQVFDLLNYLIRNRDHVVSKDDLIENIWGGRIVSASTLTSRLNAARKAIGDSGAAQQVIRTISRRGVRFVAEVTEGHELAPEAKPASAIPAPLEVLLSLPDKPSIAVLPFANRSDAPKQDHFADEDLITNPSRLRWLFVIARNSWLTYKSRAVEMRRPIIWVTAVLLLVAGATATWQAKSRWLAGAPAVPRLSIVVLPFTNLAGDPAQEYFADGITEDLTTDLSRLADMLVISRDTAFTYRGQPVSAKRIRRELGVHYIVEGSVQRSADQVRINTQLIDADADTNLWAARFDRNIDDLLALQSEITGRIAIALNLKLVTSEAARSTEHPDALDHIFRGRAAMYRPASRQNFAEAIAEYQQALALYPHSVEAQSRLAIALSSRLLDNMSDTIDSDIELASQLVEQALAAAPESPLAHFAKAQLLRAQHRCEAAIPEYEKVLAANRNVLAAIGNIGRCKIYLGQLDDGVALEEQAIHLSPRDPFLGVWYFRIGQARLLQSRVNDAIGWLEKANGENSGYWFVHAWLSAAHGLKGDLPQAATELEDARKLSGNGSPTSISAARATGARDFAPGIRALLETTYLAGLRQAGVPEE